ASSPPLAGCRSGGSAMAQTRHITQRGPGEGYFVGWQGGVVVYKALSDETDGKYCLSSGTVPAWSGPPPHVQTREDEGFYLLSGELRFTAGSETVALRAGSFLNVSRGTAHYFLNPIDTPAALLVLDAPGGFDRFQIEAGHPLSDAGARVPPSSAEDLERMAAAAPKYGIELAPPAEAFHRPPAVRVTHPGQGWAVYVAGDLYRFLAVGT